MIVPWKLKEEKELAVKKELIYEHIDWKCIYLQGRITLSRTRERRELNWLNPTHLYSKSCHNPNSTSTQPQLNSTELGLTRLLVFIPHHPTPPGTLLPSNAASDQPLMLPKQQHQHLWQKQQQNYRQQQQQQ